jgi:hypothetical protein
MIFSAVSSEFLEKLARSEIIKYWVSNSELFLIRANALKYRKSARKNF